MARGLWSRAVVLEDRWLLAASLVKDINTTPNTGGSFPENLVKVGSKLFFTATTPTAGEELWVSDGTEAGTRIVKDIYAGRESSSISEMTEYKGLLYFSARDGINGYDLWRSDGTAEGTIRYGNLHQINSGMGPRELTVMNGVLYFSANVSSRGPTGYELWKTDGTSAGLQLVKDIDAFGSSLPSSLTNVNGTLYFLAGSFSTGQELWKSDGTAAGTVLVKDIYPGQFGSVGGLLTNLNGVLYFTADDGTHGFEVWKSDGTAAGTTLVKDIVPGSGSSMPTLLTSVGGVVYFSANDGVNGQELWKTDGTEAGTVLVKDITAGSQGSAPKNLIDINGVLYFTVKDSSLGFELWKSDGTATGTVLIKQFLIGGGFTVPRAMTDVNGTLFFVGYDDAGGLEIWKSDGTAAGTVLAADPTPGANWSMPQFLTNVDGTLFFSARNGNGDFELYKTDGTQPGTALVKDIINGTSGSFGPSYLTLGGGSLYFAAEGGLWKSDGTTAGTVLVSGDVGAPMVFVNGVLYFATGPHLFDIELWKSDGTAAGTMRVKDIRPGPDGGSRVQQLTNVNGTLFFVADNGVTGNALWKSDGTATGTVLVKDIVPGNAYTRIDGLTDANGVLYFFADDGVHGQELWRSDGTAEGTVLVKDIRPGSASSIAGGLTVVNGMLYFPASDGVNGVELWKSDGTAAGTVRLDLLPGSAGAYPHYMIDVNGTLYFTANTHVGGVELWKSDGTAAGTVLVKNISAGSNIRILTNVDGTLFFAADDGVHGLEVWTSDGTAAGTKLVKDIFPGSFSSLSTDPGVISSTFVSANGFLYFSANNGVSGVELWRTDGTAEGTQLAADIAPNGDSFPSNFTVFGGSLFFTALTDEYGFELWKVSLTDDTSLGTLEDVNVAANTVVENSPIGTAVGITARVSNGSAGLVTYSLADNALGRFTIDASTGVVTVANGILLDFETGTSHSIIVRAVGPGGSSIQQLFTIDVTNVPDIAFGGVTDISSEPNAVPENSSAGTFIGIIARNGTYVPFTITYSLADNAGGRFAIDASTGIVTVANASLLNFEAATSHSITVRATAQDGATSDQQFTIDVTNVADFDLGSLIDVDAAANVVVEHSANGTIVGLTARHTNPVPLTVIYELLADAGGRFAINATTGVVTVANGSLLDFANATSHGILIRARATDGSEKLQSFTIAVTKSPVIGLGTLDDVDASLNRVTENSAAGTAVGITARVSNLAAGPITYSLTDNAGGRFTINASTGVVSVANGGLLDFEAATSHSITVRATAPGGEFLERVFTIDLVNVPDIVLGTLEDVNGATNMVPENASAGTSVGITARVSNPAAGVVAYSLIDNAGGRFQIDAASGIVTVLNAALLDFENATSHTITIRATSMDGSTVSRPFVIGVSNVPDINLGTLDDVNPAANAVPENSVQGTSVGITARVSNTAAGPVTYSLTDNAGGRFQINASTGIVTVLNASLLDFEDAISHTITIRATSGDGSTISRPFVIGVTDVQDVGADVVDVDPVGNAVAENSPGGSVVGLTFLGKTTIPNAGTVSYALLDDSDGSFIIHPTLGGIFVANGAVLDFEATAFRNITVVATWSSGLSASRTVSIRLLDVNEPPTAVTLENAVTSIGENTPPPASLGTVAVTDDALGNNVLSLSGPDAASFELFGKILRTRPGVAFDYESKRSYAVTINASDPALSGSTVSTPYVLNILDVDEIPITPVVDVDPAPNRIAENSPAGSVVGLTMRATDPNSGPNAVTYQLLDDAGGRFWIHPTLGGIFFVNGAPLDYEAAGSHTVKVQATSIDGSSSMQSFLIQVIDVNEAPKSVSVADAVRTLRENTATPAAVGTVVVADDALGTNRISLGGPDAAAFELVGSLLRVKPGVVLDYESKQTYTLTINVDDPALGGPVDATTTFVLSLEDVSEIPISELRDVDPGANRVKENASDGSIVGLTMLATDPDSGPNAVTYSLVDDAGGRFRIHPTLGGIFVANGAAIDYESAAFHTIVVKAVSVDGSSRTLAVRIDIVDVNEAPRSIAVVNAVSSIPENTPTPLSVGRVVVDDDLQWANRVWLSGADAGFFELVDGSLRLKNGVLLDYETKPSYSVTLNVDDPAIGGAIDASTVYTLQLRDVSERPISQVVDVDPGANRVNENAANGSIVGLTFSASDPDSGPNAVTYTLVDDAGGRFRIHPTLGGIFVADGSKIDRELAAAYTIVVKAQSVDGTSSTASYQIEVIDVNEAPTAVELTGFVTALPENSATPTTVARVNVIDDRLGSNAVSLSGPDAGSFELIGNQLRLRSGVVLDYEKKSSYTVTINVNDPSVGGAIDASTTFVLNVSDVSEVPITQVVDVDPSSNRVVEHAPNGSVVGVTFLARDPDSGPGAVTYSLVDDAGGRFRIHPTLGGIFVANGAIIDYESAKVYRIRVRAESIDGTSSETSLDITVIDDPAR